MADRAKIFADRPLEAERLSQLDPDSAFGSPEALVKCEALSDEAKIDALRRWYYDAVEITVAEEEGMPHREGDLTRDILLALRQLTSIDIGRTGPTKQHGLPSSP